MNRRAAVSVFFIFLLPVAAALAAADAHDHAGESAASVYQCPMHPWIKSDRPGKCTICGMDLVAAAPAAAAPEGIIALNASIITTIGVQTSVVSRQALTRTVRVTGEIDDDDTRHRILAARIPGRIEKLHINFVGAEIAAGAPLATLYSPEMLGAQRVLVERIRAGEVAFSASETAAARERLLELGLTGPEIAELEKSLAPSATVVLRAPMAGIVVAKSVYEGQYVQTSDRLFEIADFSHMWFVFDAYEQDIPWLRVGQRVQITTRAVPGELIEAPIAFIDPNFNDTTRTTKVRVVLPNPHFNATGEGHVLFHRVLAEARVLVESPAVLAAPRSAVLDAGAGPVAYVDLGDGHYERRALRLGRSGDALVEVLAGLAEGERVVTTGALLIDAQAQLAREAATHVHGAAPAATAAPRDTPSAPETAAPPAGAALAALAATAADAADALANDDYARYRRILPGLRTASSGLALPALDAGDSLKAARRSFEPWSTAVADLLKPHRAALGVKVFQCPMSPVLHKGRWVQFSQPVKNPFFGSAMPDCSEELP
jgi:membrane fusion protein, copper/silver efflux system